MCERYNRREQEPFIISERKYQGKNPALALSVLAFAAKSPEKIREIESALSLFGNVTTTDNPDNHESYDFVYIPDGSSEALLLLSALKTQAKPAYVVVECKLGKNRDLQLINSALRQRGAYPINAFIEHGDCATDIVSEFKQLGMIDELHKMARFPTNLIIWSLTRGNTTIGFLGSGLKRFGEVISIDEDEALKRIKNRQKVDVVVGEYNWNPEINEKSVRMMKKLDDEVVKIANGFYVEGIVDTLESLGVYVHEKEKSPSGIFYFPVQQTICALAHRLFARGYGVQWRD